ncbi:MAG: uracil-DNA glycosylase [Verrucomicrobiota bacterium]
MNSFQSALDYVHHALRGLHDQGVDLRASVTSLARLAQGAQSAPPSAETREPVPAVREIAVVPMPVPEPPEPVVAVPIVREPVVAPPKSVSNESGAERLASICEPAASIELYPALAEASTQIVFGLGSAQAELMFIGDVPGHETDPDGEPFAGPDGRLLTKIIETMGFPRAEVYITTLIKCRPATLGDGEPDGRKPSLEELRAALPFLRQQIEIIQPRVIVALGAGVMNALLGETQPMGRLRGRWHEFEGRPLMATYHPGYLIRNQALGEKRKVWEDMLLVLEKLGRPISPKQRGYFLPKT